MPYSCPKCKVSLTPGDRYCPSCGQRLTSASQASDDGLYTEHALSIADIQYRLAVAYFKKGDYLQAERTLEKLLERRPEDASLRALLLDVLSRLEGSSQST